MQLIVYLFCTSRVRNKLTEKKCVNLGAQELGDALKSTVAGHHTNCNTSKSVSSYAAAVN